MKKLLFVLIAITAVSFSSCKKDKKAEVENTHIGIWQVTTITKTPEGEEPFKQYDYNNHERMHIIEFNADGTLRSGDAWDVNGRVCVSNLNYTLENNEFTFTNNDFLFLINKGKLEFKGNDKIVVTGSTDGNNYTIELIKTDKKIENYILSECA